MQVGIYGHESCPGGSSAEWSLAGTLAGFKTNPNHIANIMSHLTLNEDKKAYFCFQEFV
jgi:hypothetical protein